MPIDVSVPRLGWTMETGIFAGWLKSDGDRVRPGDVLFRLEGEKATEEIESLDGGILRLLPSSPNVGDVINVGTVIGQLLTENDLNSQAPSAPDPVVVPQPSTTTTFISSPVVATDKTVSPPVSPRARRAARKLGVDVSQLTGTGTTGRIREQDVLAVAPQASLPEVISHTPIRRTIAARMVASLRETAPVTLNSTIDAVNLANLREQFKAASQSGAGLVPSITDFLIKLAGFALQQHPLLASRWTADGIIPAAQIDIGFAVDTDAGLLVPVIRDVPALGLRGLSTQSQDLIAQARSGRLPASHMGGACFTITNLGSLGIDSFTPIINPPEAAVLGVGKLERRPVVKGTEIVIREQLSLSLTFDHRIVDGAPAARFLQTLARLIENPGPWLST